MSRLVSHQTAHRGSALTQPATRGPLRLRALYRLWLLFGTNCPWMSTPLQLKARHGGSRTRSSSASSARWLTGAAVALPSLSQGHPSSPSRLREPAEPGGSSLRRRLVLCFGRCGGSTVPPPRFDLTLVFRALLRGLCTWSRSCSRTGSLRRRSGSLSSWTSTSLLPVFSRECFGRYAAASATSHQDRWWPPRMVQTVHMWCDSVLRKGGGASGRSWFRGPGRLTQGPCLTRTATVTWDDGTLPVSWARDHS